jgi:hypothetical protein
MLETSPFLPLHIKKTNILTENNENAIQPTGEDISSPKHHKKITFSENRKKVRGKRSGRLYYWRSAYGRYRGSSYTTS